ncbi:Hypothetical protein ORPV_236 [Orpheovirus IHUMI-LCC2]|uniref:Uncharacterized protein n=1 Tax=Orpheovirus IHUMI-LCC2 TaxID=2023057 RepID=A0A2I2L3P9_9VIRU|nr:Hypothetical protein ORPV_236 [Orpheovirus IHUMI-LCC2]SNW62140.1 Hypothetical protein ORPV_236 [Orpheovirus IHUMI-LCC2]
MENNKISKEELKRFASNVLFRLSCSSSCTFIDMMEKTYVDMKKKHPQLEVESLENMISNKILWKPGQTKEYLKKAELEGEVRAWANELIENQTPSNF